MYNFLKNNSNEPEVLDIPGKEHYQLLVKLSTYFNNSIIIDIGTHRGNSALALSYNETNTVYTFDIIDKNVKWEKRTNIEFFKEDLWDTETLIKYEKVILTSPLIFMDIDPHGGIMEYTFYNWLCEHDYQGILLCDDIHYFKEMRDNFWYKIPKEYKIDLTFNGHWSGTGMISFTKNFLNFNKKIEYNWTVVTAYFNLTKRQDASSEIKNRSIEFYMNTANTTMAIDQNLIVFCDSESESLLRELRPEYLSSKTKYIILEFDDIPLVYKNYDTIKKSREKRNYSPDPRNTTSYYLFCISRYYFVQQAMQFDPFGSTHFAWCNICIERMDWKCGLYLPEVWKTNRDKFSTCYIDYQSRKWLNDLEEYYKYGRCSMCSGFFTGNKEYFSKFCNLILKKFDQMTLLGLGHADEQLFTLVYFENEDIFDFYYGDYFQMIVNYNGVVDSPNNPVFNLMRNLYLSINSNKEDRVLQSYKLLLDATTKWLNSYPDSSYLAEVVMYNKYAKYNLNISFVE